MQMLGAHWLGVQVVLSLGIVLAQAINLGTQHIYPWGWRISLALAGVPAIVLTLGGIFLPETPNSLIERGKVAVSSLSATTIPSKDGPLPFASRATPAWRSTVRIKQTLQLAAPTPGWTGAATIPIQGLSANKQSVPPNIITSMIG